MVVDCDKRQQSSECTIHASFKVTPYSSLPSITVLKIFLYCSGLPPRLEREALAPDFVVKTPISVRLSVPLALDHPLFIRDHFQYDHLLLSPKDVSPSTKSPSLHFPHFYLFVLIPNSYTL